MKKIVLSKPAKNLKIGKYEHYKKKMYEVMGVGIHSETLEEVVIYRALYGEQLTWVRPLEMFLEQIEVDGVIRPRFEFKGH